MTSQENLEIVRSTPVSQENAEVVRSCMEAWNRGDFDAFHAAFHPEAEFHSSIRSRPGGSELTWRGMPTMRRHWGQWHTLWDLRVELADVRDLGGTVIALGTIKRRRRESEIVAESPVAYVLEFEGGRARKIWAYLGHDEALSAVGLDE